MLYCLVLYSYSILYLTDALLCQESFVLLCGNVLDKKPTISLWWMMTHMNDDVLGPCEMLKA